MLLPDGDRLVEVAKREARVDGAHVAHALQGGAKLIEWGAVGLAQHGLVDAVAGGSLHAAPLTQQLQ